jgi:hypothetical protein
MLDAAPFLLGDVSGIFEGAQVFEIEIVAPRGHEAERITTAFYRFLELRDIPEGAPASVHVEIAGDMERRTVRLWSEEALHDYQRFLAAFKVARPPGLPPTTYLRGAAKE